VENYTARGRSTERRGKRGAVTPISGAFPSEDGFWLLSLHDSRERWESLMEWMDDPVLRDDPSLLNYDRRLEHCDMILDRIGTWARGYPKEDLVAEAQRRRIPCAPVNTALELAADEQLIDRGFLVAVEHPQHGPMLFPRGALATVLDTTVGFAPKLGSSNRELLDELGYTREEALRLFPGKAT
jgi:crotonobetainyl-CoA:carnitine CoA-transferase CaiB-like acyl-CoA transferase